MGLCGCGFLAKNLVTGLKLVNLAFGSSTRVNKVSEREQSLLRLSSD